MSALGDSLRENFSFRSSAAISLRYRHFPRLAGTGEVVYRLSGVTCKGGGSAKTP